MRRHYIALVSLVAAAALATPAASAAVFDLGSTVSPKLRGKPLIVRVHADWCGECQTSLPDFQAFSKTYRGKINVVDIDVTDGKTAAESKARAEALGFGPYYEKTKAAPLTVAFINPDSAKVYAALRGDVTLAQLRAAEKTVENSLKGH